MKRVKVENQKLKIAEIKREKNLKQRKRHIESGIRGFSGDIGYDEKNRIDEFVKHYEETILQLVKKEYKNNSKKSELIADKIAEFGGSWKFISILFFTLIFWIGWNTVPFTTHFDEKPFVLLNLLLSCTASFQAPIIMMSQNRKAIQDKNEDIIDFAINYKSEKEISDMQMHIHKIEIEIEYIKKVISAKNYIDDEI